MAVKEWEDRIVFLRRVVPGSADKSYGIHVARLAGLPAAVLERAERGAAQPRAPGVRPHRHARGWRAGASIATARARRSSRSSRRRRSWWRDLLREVDVERLTPLAALNLLASLQERG